jgi:AcrR family transcriptional regulator
MTTAGPTKTQPGLRDRKRRETRARLEEAAVTLVLQDGLEHATIEAISDRAGVSARTFFNYFDSKEDAILGLRQTAISDEELAAHQDSHRDADVTESLVGLLFVTFGAAIADSSFREARRQVIREHPQLLGRHVTRMERMTDQLTAAAAGLLAQHGGASDAVAETLLMACMGAIRATTKQWAATDSDIPLDELERRAVLLVREAVEKLR